MYPYFIFSSFLHPIMYPIISFLKYAFVYDLGKFGKDRDLNINIGLALYYELDTETMASDSTRKFC